MAHAGKLRSEGSGYMRFLSGLLGGVRGQSASKISDDSIAMCNRALASMFRRPLLLVVVAVHALVGIGGIFRPLFSVTM